MGYVPPAERPLMPGESREDWYFERRMELLNAKDYNQTLFNKGLLFAIIAFLLVLFYFL